MTENELKRYLYLRVQHYEKAAGQMRRAAIALEYGDTQEALAALTRARAYKVNRSEQAKMLRYIRAILKGEAGRE